MKYIYEYENTTQRTNIISNNKDKYLIEERNVIDGNFLIFSTTKPLIEELEEIKNRAAATEDAIIALMMRGT